jgi:hypothetical protein
MNVGATMPPAGHDGPGAGAPSEPGAGVTSRESVQLTSGRAGHLVSPADANRAAARARIQHVPVETHFSRKGKTLSTLLCKCGHFIEVEDESLLLGHRKLEQAFSAHRRQPMP